MIINKVSNIDRLRKYLLFRCKFYRSPNHYFDHVEVVSQYDIGVKDQRKIEIWELGLVMII